MPDFTYTARDRSGKRVAGVLAGANQREVLQQLGQKALFPLEVKPAPVAQAIFGKGRVRKQAVGTFFGQLADLLQSGVPLLRALTVLEKQAKQPALQEVLTDLRSRVEEGQTLSEALARHPRTFDDLSVSVVRAGGEGGFLEEALEQISDFIEKQEDLKGRTMGAVAYPFFLMGVGILVVTGLVIFLVPRFAGIFSRLREKGELPLLTEILLWMSETLQNYGLIVLVLLVAAGFAIRSWLNTEAGRLLVDRVMIRIPLAGPVFLSLAVARFCRVLGTLLRNGVPILKSLEISSDSTGNRILARAIRQAGENISSGESLAKPLGDCGHFPPSVVEMIAVAEEANSLEKVLVKIADGLDRRTWRQLELVVRLLEPMLLVLLAGAVLLIVLALMLPVIKMSTQ